MAPKKQLKTTVPTKSGMTPTRTPERSPIKKQKKLPTITAAQKQALIDNLQLEITERARKLRAQYALHAQGLRSRLEMRVNRIPQATRNMTMGELYQKYDAPAPKKDALAAQKGASKPQAPVVAPAAASKARTVVRKDTHPNLAKAAAPVAGKKRTSDQISSDKENNNGASENLHIPKKRAKAAVQPSSVLSPKSNNSRTLPAPPKPVAASRALPKAPVQAPAKVTKAAAAKKGGIAGVARAVGNAVGRKAGVKKEAAPAAATGGRVLRSRK